MGAMLVLMLLVVAVMMRVVMVMRVVVLETTMTMPVVPVDCCYRGLKRGGGGGRLASG